MGNFCGDCFDQLSQQYKKLTGQGVRGGKGKNKFLDMNVGQQTVMGEEFKKATLMRKLRQKNEEEFRQIDELDLEQQEKKLMNEMEHLKEQEFQNRLQKKKPITTKRMYAHVKDELITNMLGFASMRALQEMNCEPEGHFSLKNSDYLIWEDQSDHLNHLILDQLIEVQQREYHQMTWTGTLRKEVISIEVVSVQKDVSNYEQEFYRQKEIEQRLLLLNSEYMGKTLERISYRQSWFMVKYSEIFLTVREVQVISLRDFIGYRRELGFSEDEILGLLIVMVKALKDADSIQICHGLITDEKIFLSQTGQFKLEGFGVLDLQITNESLKPTEAFKKYHLSKMTCRDSIFWSEALKDVIMGTNYDNDYTQQKVDNMIMRSNMYALAIIALNMLSKGQFEQEIYNLARNEAFQHKSDQVSEEQFDDQFQQKFIMQKCGLQDSITIINSFCFDHQQQAPPSKNQFDIIPSLTYESIMQWAKENNYTNQYKILMLYIDDMLKPTCDYKTIIDQLRSEDDFAAPKPESPPTFMHLYQEILEYEYTLKRALIRDFNIVEQFEKIRQYYYAAQAYIIMRNFMRGQKVIEAIWKQTKELRGDQAVMLHHRIKNVQDVILSEKENQLLKFWHIICLINNKALKSTIYELNALESISSDIISPITIKYYQGLTTYMAGEVEVALKLLYRVDEMSYGNLGTIDQRGYLMYLNLLVLCHFDNDSYFKAFKILEEMIPILEMHSRRSKHVSKALIIAYYNKAKGYFEASQFVLSQNYFQETKALISKSKAFGREFDALKLMTQGYLALLAYYLNNSEIMKQLLSSCQAIMLKFLSLKHIDSSIIWISLFGFLLPSIFQKSEDLFQFIETFQLTTQNQPGSIDRFFASFVFAKMYYYSENIPKAIELFLNALRLQQFFVADQLAIVQTSNTSTTQIKQMKDEQQLQIKHYQDLQKKNNATLPQPERDNLTVRLLIDIYDWLGYIYTNAKDQKRSEICYSMHEELVKNIFKFDATLIDEYTFRKAKILFFKQDYPACFETLTELSLILKQSKVDNDLAFEYQQIQCHIHRWIGVVYLLMNEDAKALTAFDKSIEEIESLYAQPQIEKLKHITSYNQSHMISEEPMFEQPRIDLFSPRNSIMKQQPLRRINTNLSEVSELQVQLKFNKLNMQEITTMNATDQLFEYQRLQQAPIVILMIQNFMRIIWHYQSIGLKKQAATYIEKSIEYLDKEEYLRTDFFLEIIKDSFKIDFYFLLGFIYGQQGLHEETSGYYQKAYVLINHIYNQDKSDQYASMRMATIQDQMSRVLSYQGFYKIARTNLQNSLHILDHQKLSTSSITMAYKYANLGAIELKLGNTLVARKRCESAIQVFESHFGKSSLQVLTIKFKLFEICVITDIKAANRTLLQCTNILKLLPKDQPTLQLQGCINRCFGILKAKEGRYQQAFQHFNDAFVQLLHDNEFAHEIQKRIKQGETHLVDEIKVTISDRHSLEILHKIIQLYIDNDQDTEALHLIKDIQDKQNDEKYDAPKIRNIQLFGNEITEELIKLEDGILFTLKEFSEMKNLSNKSVYEAIRDAMFKLMRSHRHINLVYYADTIKYYILISNKKYQKKREPYLHQDYSKLLHLNNMPFKSKKNVNDKKNYSTLEKLRYIMVIYMETLGDQHQSFTLAWYHYTLRQYLKTNRSKKDSDKTTIEQNLKKIEQSLPNLIRQLKFNRGSMQIQYLDAQLMQIKCQLRENKIAAITLKFISFLPIKDDNQILTLIRLLRCQSPGIYQLFEKLDYKIEYENNCLEFTRMVQDKIDFQDDDQIPGQVRILNDALNKLQKLKNSVDKLTKQVSRYEEEQLRILKCSIERLNFIIDTILLV